MRPQVRFVGFEEGVHLVSHVENVFPAFEEITEHDDILQRCAHLLEAVFYLIKTLTGLFLDAAHDRASTGALLVGRPARRICKWVSSCCSGQKQNIDVSPGAKTGRP